MRKEKTHLHEILISTVFLIVVIGITACSDSGPLSQDKPDNKREIKTGNSPAYAMQSQSSGDILGEPLTITESGVFDPPPNASIEGGDYTVTTTMEMPNSYTTLIHASGDGQNSTPGDFTWDLGKSAVRQMPTQVSYSGGSMLHYVVDGQQKSFSMNDELTNILSTLQQHFFDAVEAYENMPAATGGSNPLLSKTDQEIKQMLQAQGFSVTIVGNKLFEIRKAIAGIETTQIFDAEDWSTDIVENSYVGDPDFEQFYYDQDGTYQPERIVN